MLKKQRFAKLMSVVLFLLAVCLIVPSGFRGDVGPDSATYRVIYDSINVDIKKDLFNKFEPGFSFVMFASKLVGFDYADFQILVTLLSLVSLLFVFRKTSSVNFVLFICLYFDFVYFQLQWSVIRNCIAFWIFSVLIVFFKNSKLPGLCASLFHFSFLLSLTNIRLRNFLMLILLFFALFGYYYWKYSFLNTDLLLSFFWGGPFRLFYHLGLLVVFLYFLGFFRHRLLTYIKQDPKISLFLVLFIAGFTFPLGWRLIAIAIPLLLLVDFSHLSIKKLIGFCAFSLLVFVQKTSSFTLNEIATGDYPVLFFLLNL
jgi:hypothetical protein